MSLMKACVQGDVYLMYIEENKYRLLYVEIDSLFINIVENAIQVIVSSPDPLER